MDERKVREQRFHDARFSAEHARAADRFYSITSGSRETYQAKLQDVASHARVLEFGCGTTSSAFALAERGARVTAIDISPVAVELARQEAAARAVELSFATMDAESLDFPNDSFDFVCGNGILHHLMLDRAFAELARVLVRDGRAVFTEPLGHNPLVNWYRNRTPEQRTSDEHPLVLADFDLARTYFHDVRLSFHHLATLAAIPFCATRAVEPMSRMLDSVDRALFTIAPALKRFAWVVVVELGQPRAPSR